MSKKIAVVGGGISGLSSAYFSLKKGFNVDLFESTDRLGGLAASFDFNGLTIERYYHFICGGDDKLIELANNLGIGDRIKFYPSKTSIYYNGQYYPFATHLDLLRFSPIPLNSRLKFGFHILYSKYRKGWEKLDSISAKDWLCQHIGEEGYRVIWHPLLKIKFGKYYDRISAAWVWHRIHRVATSRKGPFSKEKMGYFEGGSQTLITKLQGKIEELGGKIHLRSEIQEIAKENEAFKLTLGSKEEAGFDRIVLAVPLPIAAQIIKNLNPGLSRQLSSVVFFGVVCGISRLKENITDAFWLNINDSRIAANGLIEYTNINPLEEISPDKIVYIPYYAPIEDNWFSMEEESLKQEFFNMLKIIKPDLTKNAVKDMRVHKSRHAQAICTVGFKDRVPPVETPIKNLYILDSTQVYPSDRALSPLIGLAEKMVEDFF
jgi:protoporphyrinogen oxidase